MQIHMKHGVNIQNRKKVTPKKIFSQLSTVNLQGGLLFNKAAPCGRQNRGQESKDLSLGHISEVNIPSQGLDTFYIS